MSQTELPAWVAQSRSLIIVLIRRWALVLMPLLVGFFGYLMQTTFWFDFIPGDLSDARFNSVILEHQFLWLKGQVASFWNPDFFYPASNVLAFSDSHIGSGWSYVLFRGFDFSRESAYLGWFTLAACLNYTSCFYVLSRMGCGVLAAGLGAFVYAFGLPALSQEAHAQLNNRYFVPLAAFFFYRFLIDKKIGNGCRAIIWASLQFFCSIYIGVFVVYFFVAMYVTNLIAFNGFRSTAELSRPYVGFRSNAIAALFAGVMLVLTALLLWKYFQVSRFYGFDTNAVAGEYMLPRPVSYLLADRSALSQWVGLKLGGSIPSFYRHEHQLFIGLGPLVLMVIGIVVAFTQARLASLARVMAASLLLVIIFTLRVEDFSFYSSIYELPGVSAIRVVSRIILVLLFPAAVLVALAIDYVLRIARIFFTSHGRIWMCLMGLLLATTVCIESVFYKPYHESRQSWVERQERLNNLMIAPLSKNSILYLTQSPLDPWPAVSEIDAMIYAQDRGLSTLNGYSGNEPPGFLNNHPCVSPESRLGTFFRFKNKEVASLDELSRQIVLVNPTPCADPIARVADTLFPAQSAKALYLSIQELKQTAQRVFVTLRFTNESVSLFSTVYKPSPVRLSWRFLPTNEPQATSLVGWDARFDLYLSLQPGQSEQREIVVDLPSTRGQYVLEFSLVHEGKYWFHNFEMPIPAVTISVP